MLIRARMNCKSPNYTWGCIGNILFVREIEYYWHLYLLVFSSTRSSTASGFTVRPSIDRLENESFNGLERYKKSAINET